MLTAQINVARLRNYNKCELAPQMVFFKIRFSQLVESCLTFNMAVYLFTHANAQMFSLLMKGSEIFVVQRRNAKPVALEQIG